jgi:hypothetical protein
VPGQDLNGNVVTGNLIGVNNLDGDHFGIWTTTTGPVTVQHAKNNLFLKVAVPIATG